MDLYASLPTRADLRKVLRRAREQNDLLPPRVEDKVRGELGKRFSASLAADLTTGAYRPEQAAFVAVPKPNHTTRPAALMTLRDRTIYEAIVGLLRDPIEAALLADNIVMWPRGKDALPRWPEFEKAPLEVNGRYIVRADVAGFYESVRHDVLKRTVIAMTGLTPDAILLVKFLTAVMGCDRGLPQGSSASDPIATCFLSDVDVAMTGQGYAYVRHGDDIRISVPDYPTGRESIFLLENELRKVGLLLNGAKCRILKRKTYADQLASVDRATDEVRNRLTDLAVQGLMDAESDELSAVMDEAGLDSEMQWALFYHQTVGLEDVLEELRDYLTPGAVRVAEELFRDTISRRPGVKGGLPREIFHQRIASSLTRMAAAKSPSAVDQCGDLLVRYPDKTAQVATYLLALASKSSDVVAQQAEKALLSAGFRLGWQTAWQLRVLGRVAAHLSQRASERVREIAHDEDSDWLARVEATKVLAARGELEQRTARSMWRHAPVPYRPDIIAAVASMGDGAAWAPSFLTFSKTDPVYGVIAGHARSQKSKRAK